MIRIKKKSIMLLPSICLLIVHIHANPFPKAQIGLNASPIDFTSAPMLPTNCYNQPCPDPIEGTLAMPTGAGGYPEFVPSNQQQADVNLLQPALAQTASVPEEVSTPQGAIAVPQQLAPAANFPQAVNFPQTANFPPSITATNFPQAIPAQQAIPQSMPQFTPVPGQSLIPIARLGALVQPIPEPVVTAGFPTPGCTIGGNPCPACVITTTCLGALERLRGENFMRKDNSLVPAENVLHDKKLIAFYFSASWCHHCTTFTPKLKKFYDLVYRVDKFGVELVNKFLEIIFVSADHGPNEQRAYFQQMGNWLSVPFGSQLQEDLKTMFHVDGYPTLIVYTTDGTLLESNGVDYINAEGAHGAKIWLQTRPKE